MSLLNWRLNFACVIWIVCLIAPPAAKAQQADAAATRIEPKWTKVQDLNPNAPPTNSPIKQKWAVVIGVGKHKESRLDSDERPDEAAGEFRQYLLDSHGGRFDEKHVKALLNDDATQQEIVSVLGSSWLGKLAGEDDLVVVFIAASGFPTTDGNSYLCTYNCALDNIYSTCLSVKTLMDLLKTHVQSKRIVLVLQACYSGAAELSSGAKALFSNLNLDPEKLSLGRGYVVISSSRPDQASWGNIFAKNLVKALRQDDGLIPVERAFEQARDATERDTRIAYKLQTPVIKSDWKGHDLVLGSPAVDKASELPDGVVSFLGAESHYLKANRLVEAGKTADALKEYAEAVSADPKYADALADYGAALAMTSDWMGAAEKYKQAIAVRPDDSLFHANYARVLSKLGLAEECMRELETAYKLDPKDRNVLSALSDRLLAAGQKDRAVSLLVEAVALYPGSASLHNRLSYALSLGGDTEKALSNAREATRLDPQSQQFKLNLGSVMLMDGQIDNAISVYQDVIRTWPNCEEVHFLLASALETRGDLPAARAELQRFLQVCSPADARAEKARNKLRELESH